MLTEVSLDSSDSKLPLLFQRMQQYDSDGCLHHRRLLRGYQFRNDCDPAFPPLVAISNSIVVALIRAHTENATLLQLQGQRDNVVVEEL